MDWDNSKDDIFCVHISFTTNKDVLSKQVFFFIISFCRNITWFGGSDKTYNLKSIAKCSFENNYNYKLSKYSQLGIQFWQNTLCLLGMTKEQYFVRIKRQPLLASPHAGITNIMNLLLNLSFFSCRHQRYICQFCTVRIKGTLYDLLLNHGSNIKWII